MKVVVFALMAIVVSCVMAVAADADTVDVRAGGPAIGAIAQPSGQVDVAANAGAAEASAGSPAATEIAEADAQPDTTESGEKKDDRIYISLNYYAYIPSDGETREHFGRIWHSFGIGRFRPERPEKWVFDWDVTFWSKDGESDVLIIPLSVGVQRGLSPDPKRQSYVALRAGPYWGRVTDNLVGPDESKFGFGANAALGMVVNQKYVFEARYDWFSKLAGNDLSGFTLTAGVKVFGFSL